MRLARGVAQVQDEPDRARRAERRAEGRVREQIDGRDAHERAAEVGDQPDRPHSRAEAVETRHGLAVLARQDDGRPHGVDDHEDDRQGPGRRVSRVCRGAPRDHGHDRRPRRVAHEAPVRGDCAGYPSNAA